jgi:DNA polymerase III delta prime subunit
MIDLVDAYLWVEKYRPKELGQMVLSDQYRIIFEGFISKNEIPHLLLYGPPGSGKTTLARVLIDNLSKDSADLLTLNGSTSTGVDVVRNLIEEFLKVPSFSSSTKIVFIDEADYLSGNAQAALRNITETYHEAGRFIFTCNYLSKIIDALQSRCQSFEFRKLPINYILSFCKDILSKENIEYDETFLKKLISSLYPDVRKIVNVLQSRASNGKLEIQRSDVESNEKLFRSYITDMISGINGDPGKTNEAITSMLKLLSQVELDYVGLYQEIFNDDNVPIWAKIVINQYAGSHTTAMVPAMNLMSCVYKILNMGKELRELKR